MKISCDYKTLALCVGSSVKYVYSTFLKFRLRWTRPRNCAMQVTMPSATILYFYKVHFWNYISWHEIIIYDFVIRKAANFHTFFSRLVLSRLISSGYSKWEWQFKTSVFREVFNQYFYKTLDNCSCNFVPMVDTRVVLHVIMRYFDSCQYK